MINDHLKHQHKRIFVDLAEKHFISYLICLFRSYDKITSYVDGQMNGGNL